MITVERIKACRALTVVAENRDSLVFQAVSYDLDGQQNIEVLCPLIQGRLQLKSSKARVLSGPEAAPEDWEGEQIEQTLEGLMTVDEANKLAEEEMVEEKSKAPPAPPDLTDVEESMAQTLKLFDQKLKIKDPGDRLERFANLAMKQANKIKYE